MTARTVSRLLVVSVFGAALLCASTAAAQDSDKVRRAKVHYKQGRDYYAAKAYDLAIDEYKKAYALMPLPALHFNIGQAYRLKGEPRKALEYYRLYLEAEPNGRAADEARAHVANLTKTVVESTGSPDKGTASSDRGDEKPGAGAGDRGPTSGPTKTADPGDATPRTSARDEMRGEPAPAETRTDLAKSAEPAPAKGGKGMKIAGIATAGAGLVALGLGIKFGLDAKSISDELSDHTGAWTPELLDKEAQGQSANTKMILFTAVGAGALVAGGVLYVLGSRSAKGGDRRVSVAPALAPSGVALAVNGRF